MKVRKCTYLDPFEVFLWLKEKGYPVTVFLDSARVNPKTGRYSIICIGIEKEFSLREDEKLFEKLERFYLDLKDEYLIPHLPFGIYGYLSYDANRFIENVPLPRVDDVSIPDAHFILPYQTLIFDNLSGECFQVTFGDFVNFSRTSPKGINFSSKFLRTNMDKEYFIWAVEKIKDYIAAGDTFQVNFSQRFDVSFSGSKLELYAKLRSLNPSPFSFYFELGNFTAVSCSPERLLRVNGGLAETRPIAGTRRRGRNESEDYLLERELMLSEKERAEHVMLVDLERNDLGKVCEYGTVEVDELMVVEKYSHVIHIVSNVIGKLKRNVSPIDAVKALFPGGTITGAPKVRTMEIIAELEPTRRGLYTGSVGYIGFNGNLDLNIVIRTLLFKENLGMLQVGAGIVWDSDPLKEYEETLHKGRVLLESLGVKF